MSVQKRNPELVDLLRADFIDHDTGVIKDTLRAKGDVFVATARATIIRLPVGADDEVIIANAAAADGSGVEWAALGGAGVPVSHPGLSTLGWVPALHTGTANSFAYFDTGGVAGYITDTSDGDFVVGSGAGWAKESGLTARTSMGAAPNDGGYLMVVLDSELSQDRQIVSGLGLVYTDLGANSTYTINMGTPGSSSVSSTNSATASSHTHAVTASSAPGAAAALMKTGSVGEFTFGGLLTAGAGLAVTGDITVTGTVDGVDVALANAATYVTVATTTALANERVLTGGSGIDLTDGGAGTTITIDLGNLTADWAVGGFDIQIANTKYIDFLNSGAASDGTGFYRSAADDLVLDIPTGADEFIIKLGGVDALVLSDGSSTSVVLSLEGTHTVNSTVFVEAYFAPRLESSQTTSTIYGLRVVPLIDWTGIGTLSAIGLSVEATVTDGTDWFPIANTGVIRGISIRNTIEATSVVTLTHSIGLQVYDDVLGGGGTAEGISWGVYVPSHTKGTSQNVAFYTTQAASATGAYAIFADGDAKSRFDGPVGIKMDPVNDFDVTGTGAFTSTLDVGGDLMVGPGASEILRVNVSGTRVGINMTADFQFDLDILGSLRVGGYIVGKHAIQLNEAFHIWHFDNAVTNYQAANNTNVTLVSHFGSSPSTAEGGIHGRRPGKFGTALATGRAATNRLPNPRFETPADTAAYTGWTSDGSGDLYDTVEAVAVADPVVGQYALHTVSPATPAGTVYVHDSLVAATDYTAGDTVTVSVYIRTSAAGYSLVTNDVGGIGLTYTDVSDTGGEFVRYTQTITTGGSSTSVVVNLYHYNSGVSEEAWWQGAQFEVEEYASSYMDGWMGGFTAAGVKDGGGHTWSGTAGASYSSRLVTDLRYSVTMPTTTWTVMYWAYFPDGESTAASMTTGMWHNSSTDYNLFCYRNSGQAAGTWYLGHMIRDSSAITLGTKTGVTAGWHFLAYSYDGNAGTVDVYFDDDAVVQTSLPGTAFGTVPDTLYVGQSNSGSHFNSLLDEWAITNDAMSALKIRAIYESDAPVFAESSNYEFAAGPYQLVWADENGLWVQNTSGLAVFGVLGNAYYDGSGAPQDYAWGGLTDMNVGDVLLGTSTNGVHWDDSAGTLTIGDLSNERIELDGTNGIQIFNAAGVAAITAATSGDVEITGVLEIGTSGGIWQGTGTFAAPTDGIRLDNDGGIGEFTVFESSVRGVWIDETGFNIEVDATAYTNSSRALSFINGAFTTASISSSTLGVGRTSFIGMFVGLDDYPHGTLQPYIEISSVLTGASNKVNVYGDQFNVSSTLTSITGTAGLEISKTLTVVEETQTEHLRITDGITAPGATTAKLTLYVDTADGHLKAIFGDSILQTLARGDNQDDIIANADLIAVGGIKAGGAAGDDPATGEITATGSMWINETVNGKMTTGLTINQGASDNEILALKSSDVGHGMTDIAEVDTFAAFTKSEATSGGLKIEGLKDANGSAGLALELHGLLDEAADTTLSTSGIGVINLNGGRDDGFTGINPVADAGNLLSIQNDGSALFLMDGSGQIRTFATGARSIQMHLTGVGHTFTDHTQTDAVGSLGYWDATAGGLNVHGWKDGASDPHGALVLNGALAEAPDETTSNAGHGVIRIIASMKTTGTAKGALGSADNLLSIENDGTSVAIWHGDGTLHVAAAAFTAEGSGDYDAASMDAYDDAALLRTLERLSPAGVIDTEWDRYIEYNKDTLVEVGILAPDDKFGNLGFLNMTRLQRAHNGAIWQLTVENKELRRELNDLKSQVKMLVA